MELLFGTVVAAATGYIIHKLELLESKMNEIENELIWLKQRLPKRKDDIGY